MIKVACVNSYIFTFSLFLYLHTLHIYIHSARACLLSIHFTVIVVLYAPADICSTTTCGCNSICREHNGVGSCTCMQDYFGDPYIGCRPECLQSFDCPFNFACINAKCVDPCENSCGMNAECSVINHSPMCYCAPGYTGNAVIGCHPIPDNCKTSLDKLFSPIRWKKTHFHWFILFVFHSKAYLPIPRNDPCRPSPCGLYTECHVIENHPVCSCLSGYLGAPPDCHPECMINAQCPFDKACVNQQCVDPCPGICGLNAMCRAVNHNPICSCMPGYNGDPFDRCVPNPEPSKLLCWKKRDTQFFSFMILKLMLLLSIPFESFETPVEFTIFSILWWYCSDLISRMQRVGCPVCLKFASCSGD